MRITLQRTCDINQFDAVVTVESMTDSRQDIVELLRYIQEQGGMAREADLASVMGDVPSMIISGIINHLKSNGYLQQNGTLAPKSKQVIDSGLIPMEERGLFTFYFLQDVLFQDRLIHYDRSKRARAVASTTESIDETRFAGAFYTSVIHNNQFKLKHFDGNRSLGSLRGKGGICEIRWEIDTTKERLSQFFLKGELKGDIDKTFRADSFDFDFLKESEMRRLLHSIIDVGKKPGMDWNPAKECLEVPLGQLPEEDYVRMQTTLRVSALTISRLGQFEATEMHEIPIAPKNATDAKKWLLILIAKFLKDGYKSFKELQVYLDEVKDHNAFRNFEYVMDGMSQEDILHELRESRQFESYWNMQAPLDLFTEIDDRFLVRQRQIDLADGRRLSMSELVRLLTGGERPDILLFSSKYVKNTAQIKKFEMFAGAFKEIGVRQVVLVTKEHVRFRDPIVQTELYDDVYAGSIHPHDRYFAYRTNGSWHRYKMTAELDQCRFENVHTADLNTPGEWQDITFMEILQDVFPAKLNERISLAQEVTYR
jgi:hypothetical protein